MKNKLYNRLPLLILFISILSSCTKRTDWDVYGVNGKVKTYVEDHYKAIQRFGEWKEGERYPSINRHSISFTEEGNYKQKDLFDSDYKLFERQIATYENGKMVEEIKYFWGGFPKGKIVYAYPSDTERKSSFFDIDGSQYGVGKTILKGGKIIQRDFSWLEDDGSERFDLGTHFLYDGDIIPSGMKEIYPSDVKHVAFKYIEFDDQNNWTKRLDYVNGNTETPEKIVIRTYEYYEE